MTTARNKKQKTNFRKKITELRQALKDMVDWYGGLADDAGCDPLAKRAVANARRLLDT